MSERIFQSEHEGEKILHHCSNCGHETNHTIHKEFIFSATHDESLLCWKDCAQIIQCDGCRIISFRLLSWFSEDFPDDQPKIKVYPEIQYDAEKETYLPEENIPTDICSVYKEILKAVSVKLYLLATIGIRTIIEAICKEQNVSKPKAKLETQINDLQSHSLITKNGAEILHRLRLAGNAATHDNKSLGSEQVLAALKIIEHLFQGLYVIPQNEMKTLDIPPVSKNFPEKEARP